MSKDKAVPVERKAEHLLAEEGVFKGHEGLRGLFQCNAFWEQQPYGTRFYFDGAGYLHRSVLGAAISALDKLAAAPTPNLPAPDAAEPVAWMHLGKPYLTKQWGSDIPLYAAPITNAATQMPVSARTGDGSTALPVATTSEPAAPDAGQAGETETDALFRKGAWLVEGERVPKSGAVLWNTHKRFVDFARSLERRLTEANRAADLIAEERDAFERRLHLFESKEKEFAAERRERFLAMVARADKAERALAEERVFTSSYRANLAAIREGRSEVADELNRIADSMDSMPGHWTVTAPKLRKAADALRASEKDAGRWTRLCDLWAASTILELRQLENGYWAIKQIEAVDNETCRALYGGTPDETIDAAIAKEPR